MGKMRRTVNIIGGGPSAAAAAMTLGRHGWDVRLCHDRTHSAFPIVLNSIARFLIKEMWDDRLLRRVEHHRLNQRLIAWTDGEPEIIPEPAIVVGAGALAGAMRQSAAECGVSFADSPGEDIAEWSIFATGRELSHGQPAAKILNGGRRRADVARVRLSDAAQPDTLLIEATSSGWLALVPTGQSAGSVFAISADASGAARDNLDLAISGSRHVRAWTHEVEDRFGDVAAAPRLRVPPYRGPGSLFAGEAAISFDPLSGDGTGAALRTAHLAACIVEAAAAGGDIDELQGFYRDRLATAMKAHLRGLISLYGAGPFRRAWNAEFDAMHAMASAVDATLNSARVPGFHISPTGLVRA